MSVYNLGKLHKQAHIQSYFLPFLSVWHNKRTVLLSLLSNRFLFGASLLDKSLGNTIRYCKTYSHLTSTVLPTEHIFLFYYLSANLQST
jgi:hypothetical protein